MGRLTRRLDLETAHRGLAGDLRRVGRLLIDRGIEGLEKGLAQTFPLVAQPRLEWLDIDAEVGQKIAAVEVDGLGKSGRRSRGDAGSEASDVGHDRRPVQLDAAAPRAKKIGAAGMQRLAQRRQGMAQAVLSLPLVDIMPEEVGKVRARQRVPHIEREADEQRERLPGRKVEPFSAAPRRAETAEELKMQWVHGRSIRRWYAWCTDSNACRPRRTCLRIAAAGAIQTKGFASAL